MSTTHALSEAELAELNENVQRGVALLDKEMPDWRERIDLPAFDIQECESCVLGFCYGGVALDEWDSDDEEDVESGYDLGLIQLFADQRDTSATDHAIRHGFDRPDYWPRLHTFDGKRWERAYALGQLGRASCRERVWIPV